jgi:hypothetical protein
MERHRKKLLNAFSRKFPRQFVRVTVLKRAPVFAFFAFLAFFAAFS